MLAQQNVDCQKLLHSLKVTVEGLLVNQVTNVWNIYGGLNRLCFALEKIFKHGCKLNEEGAPDVWAFIEGLSKLQPSVVIDFSTRESQINLSANIRNDKSLIWIYKNLQEHFLSKNLSLLLADQNHVAACYTSNAFFLQEKYANAAVMCIKAVEQSKSSYLLEIDPSLYIIGTVSSTFQRCHKRCSSLPEGKLAFIKTIGEEKTLFENEASICSSKNCFEGATEIQNSHKERGNNVQAGTNQQKKLCNSLPNLIHESVEKEKSFNKASHVKISPTVLEVDYGIEVKSFEKENTTEFENAEKKLKRTRRKQIRLPPDEKREWFVVQGKKEERKKTFMEDGGISVLPMSTAYFPRPLQGQSLTSFLQSENFSKTVAELDRENAHFSISEAMISAIEQMKCNRQLHLVEEVNEDDSDEEIIQLKQRIRLRRRQRLEEKYLKNFWSINLLSDGKTDTTTDQSISPLSSSPETPPESISTDDIDDLEVDEESNLTYLKNSDISVSMASLYSEADVSKTRKDGPEFAVNAENVALSLLRQFKKKQLPRASDLEWLVSEEDAPQELLPLPKSWPVSPDDGDCANAPSLRGTTDWAPPRPQIIFTPHPAPVRKTLLEKQNFRCAGCGLRVTPKFSHKFRYCEYLGRFFCTGCHTNQLSVIPGHILFKWNFKSGDLCFGCFHIYTNQRDCWSCCMKGETVSTPLDKDGITHIRLWHCCVCSTFPVSSFSYRLIDQMSTDPLFSIKDLNLDLYKKVKALEKTRQLRLQLYYFKDFLFTCRFAQELQNDFEKEPLHLCKDPEIYSLQDLMQVKTGELVSRLRELVKDCFSHVQNCQLCSARGFVCELCPLKEPIYPWSIDEVSRCFKCGACFHFQCFKPGFCPRCARVSARRQTAIDSDF